MRISYSKNEFYNEFVDLINTYANTQLLKEKDVILAYTPGRILYELNNVYTRMCFDNRTLASEDMPMLSATNPQDAYAVISFITELSTKMANKYGKDFSEEFDKELKTLNKNLRNDVVANFIYPVVIGMICTQLLMPVIISEDNMIK